MTDSTPSTAPRRRLSTTAKAAIALTLVIVWTAAAGDWQDKDCTLPQGYGFVILHGGWPDEHEGCEDEPGGPVYTSEYGRW
jgi:hypothetical protein